MENFNQNQPAVQSESRELVDFLTPNNLEQAMKVSEFIAASDLAPKDYKGKPANCLIAMQMGLEVGLKPMQAIQNIAVINGRPSIWGDAIPAIIKQHPAYAGMKEWYDEQTQTAHCVVRRNGDEEVHSTFSMEDARIAGLANKQGPWKQYPKRMCQMRARGFAVRDQFPDALRGMQVAEEQQDMKDVNAAPTSSTATTTKSNKLNAALANNEQVIEEPQPEPAQDEIVLMDFEQLLETVNGIDESYTEEDHAQIKAECGKYRQAGRMQEVAELLAAYNAKKSVLTQNA